MRGTVPRSNAPNHTQRSALHATIVIHTWYHRMILGCRARGLQAWNAAGHLSPFDHKTGEGHIPFHGGDYYDARSN